MKNGIIIFSRMSSSRLYGKALQDICGKPLIGRVIQRSQKVNNCKVVVATSDSKDDMSIIKYCEKLDIEVFVGSLDNVLRRAYECAKYFNFDRFARVCGDRPLFDYRMLGNFMRIHEKKNLDLLTNSFPPTYPKGMTIEIISYKSISSISKIKLKKDDNEHITNYFYRNPDNFKIKNISSGMKNLSNYNLSVDTLEDLKKINWIYQNLNNIFDFDISTLTDLLEKWEKK